MRGIRMRAAAAVLGAAAELVYPRRCPVCDRPVRPAGALVCGECGQVPEPVRDPSCRRCGKPLGAQSRARGHSLCGDCRRVPHAYERGCAVFTYRSTAGGLFRFKYGGRREYGAYYGAQMARRLREAAPAMGLALPGELPAPAAGGVLPEGRQRAPWEAPGIAPAGMTRGSAIDCFVPVPLSDRRLERRGYNQAAVLARALGAQTGIPVREDVLRRVEDTRPMKEMGPRERQNNLKKAFHAYGNDVELSTIVLIDDIYTTGATMDACAQALYRRGARRVCFMALAIGEDRDISCDTHDRGGSGLIL